MDTTIEQVIEFCRTASASERSMILSAMNSGANRKQRAAATLSQISAGNLVTFFYDRVQYEGEVVRINQTTATVKITKITGIPRRDFHVGSQVRVGASLLKDATTR